MLFTNTAVGSPFDVLANNIEKEKGGREREEEEKEQGGEELREKK